MNAEKLTDEQIKSRLPKQPGWTLSQTGAAFAKANELTRSYKFPSFSRALLFVNAVGLLAEAADHHPDVLIQFNRVILKLSTHTAGGITELDFALASKIDLLPIE